MPRELTKRLSVLNGFVVLLQLAMRGPPGPMGLTGRSGPVVSFPRLCLKLCFTNQIFYFFFFLEFTDENVQIFMKVPRSMDFVEDLLKQTSLATEC